MGRECCLAVLPRYKTRCSGHCPAIPDSIAVLTELRTGTGQETSLAVPCLALLAQFHPQPCLGSDSMSLTSQARKQALERAAMGPSPLGQSWRPHQVQSQDCTSQKEAHCLRNQGTLIGCSGHPHSLLMPTNVDMHQQQASSPWAASCSPSLFLPALQLLLLQSPRPGPDGGRG